MKHSDSLASLAPALVQATALLRGVAKDSVNPHFKSKFASLDAIMAEVRPVLAQHGLTVLQGAGTPHTDETGRLTAVTVETTVLHVSGEWISSSVVMPIAKMDPQGAGAAVSYGRRYGVSALLAIVSDEDDDGNSAMPTPRQQAQQLVQQAQPQSRPAAPAAPARVERGGAPTPIADLVPQAMQAAARGGQTAEPSCPKCNGRMWDNREKKTNPKAPDYKCRDKACDGLYWPGAWPPVEASEAVEADTYDDFDVNAYAPSDAMLPF